MTLEFPDASTLDRPSTPSMSPQSSNQLVLTDPHWDCARAAAAGDRAAASEVLRLVAPYMRKVIAVILRSHGADADDVLQEAMLGFLRALPAFRGECLLTSYASRIAARAAMAARRRGRARSHDEFDESAHRIVSSRSPEAITDSEERQTLMFELLDALPPEQAETLGLRVVLGLSLQEVADLTHVPLNTVRSRVRLAKEALRERILANPAYLQALGEAT